jgi:nitric oxide reductase NorQ protein
MSDNQTVTVLTPRPSVDFVNTPFVSDLADRALSYIRAGYGVHLRGPAGTGKTTLAMHIAGLIGRPVMLMFGDDELKTSDLIGASNGYSYKRLHDNYIHSVVRVEEDVNKNWTDNRLTVACREGFTLVYDEFTRSRPEANNVLLATLEEKLLSLPTTRSSESYMKVHPNFCAIFTSNPEEYVGVHKTQDALLDRMITIDIDRLDQETEVAITQAKSGLSREETMRIVEIVRDFRELSKSTITPTIRSCVMISKVMIVQASRALASDQNFTQTCRDVLLSRLVHGRVNALELAKADTLLDDLINNYCRDELSTVSNRNVNVKINGNGKEQMHSGSAMPFASGQTAPGNLSQQQTA